MSLIAIEAEAALKAQEARRALLQDIKGALLEALRDAGLTTPLPITADERQQTAIKGVLVVGMRAVQAMSVTPTIKELEASGVELRKAAIALNEVLEGLRTEFGIR